MVAYSFQKRFIGHIVAGLEPGPWLPGMKRHTLRLPRSGRSHHARPEQPLQLYTAMRTKQCRKIGNAVCRLQMPVQLTWTPGNLRIRRREGEVLGDDTSQLAPIVRDILQSAVEGGGFCNEYMDEFARTDGFADQHEMARFFDPPELAEDGFITLELVLIGWAPGDPQ